MTGKKKSGKPKLSINSRKTINTIGLIGVPVIDPEILAEFKKTILTYYAQNGRDLPWRHTTDPYSIFISEIMLQQTQVDRVVKKYTQFLTAFPTFADLAKAPLSSVLAAWQGMGYNRRAIALCACAKIVSEEYHGNLPDNPDVLATLPGIGVATACSIAAFAFNMPVVFIETNIRRVFIHFFFEDRLEVADLEIYPIVAQALLTEDPRTWYSALMDYGTMLKSSVPNPNRRSAHYTRQSKFEGSDREIRGRIIKTLVQEPGLDEKILVRNSGNDPRRVTRIVSLLEREGYLIRENGFVRLSE